MIKYSKECSNKLLGNLGQMRPVNLKSDQEFPGGLVVRTPRFHCRGTQVQSLAGELRSRKPRSTAKKKEK